KTNGTIVYDGSIAGVGKITTPIKLEVKKGKATIVSKNKDSTKLKKLLESVGPKAYNLAELGIGTNPNAILTGNVLEDEKVLGTCHIALGNDLSYNGTNNVPIHLDGIILKPTITVDGKIIMKDGKEYF
ncbi:MAG: aminopeptidase, partial [Candidatus Woesearchaeota archaeon]